MDKHFNEKIFELLDESDLPLSELLNVLASAIVALLMDIDKKNRVAILELVTKGMLNVAQEDV